MEYLPRSITPALRIFLETFRVVQVSGARQVGKTTLVASEGGQRRHVTLDDDAALRHAVEDPSGFLRSLGPGNVAIDEVQRAPNLLLAIKREVDEDPRKGRYLITGSAEVRAVAGARDSLAGRLGSLTLRPLTQGEIHGTPETFLDRLLSPAETIWESAKERGFLDLADRILAGGYPEAFHLDPVRQRLWLRRYVDSVLARDVRDLLAIEDVNRLRRVFGIIASQSGQLLKHGSIARDAELAKGTALTWISLLAATHLIDVLPAWGGSHRSRVVHMPKVYLGDSGVLAAVLRITKESVAMDRPLSGTLTETFVVQEILRQADFDPDRGLVMSHYRDRDQREVDLIIEDDMGSLVAIEIKASGNVVARDARHIEAVARAAGKRFRRGIVMYAGEHPLPLTEHVTAVPIANLWSG